MKKFKIISLICCLFFAMNLRATEIPLFYKIDLKKEVGSTTWRYVQNGLKEASRLQAKAIILHMNTYGGTVLHADSIRTAILNSSLPVYAFIDNNAASAGALIAIACDSIYMRSGANIGAATVVNETGAAMPDKYQSYMRSTIRATAEAQGADTIISAQGDTVIKWRRDPLIAEAMVDQRVVIPQLSDSGKVLTFTAQEALKYGYCESIVENVNDIITHRLGVNKYTLKEYKPTLFDDIAGFLSNPALQAILVMIIIGGIYFELQTPGIGFPSAAALIAALLYFTPLYLEGLAANWEILVFVVGIILLILEFIVIPGFGVAGIAGFILIFSGLILALINNIDFNFKLVSEDDIARSILTVVAGIALGVGLIVYFSSRIGSRGFFRRLALQETQDVERGYTAVSREFNEMVGRTGITRTMMRPSGKVKIGTEEYDAVARFGYIEKDVKVVVVKTENSQLYVSKEE